MSNLEITVKGKWVKATVAFSNPDTDIDEQVLPTIKLIIRAVEEDFDEPADADHQDVDNQPVRAAR